MIIATMTIPGDFKVTLNDHGIWESTDLPWLAKSLNLHPNTSPRKSYDVPYGGRRAFYIEVAKEVAKQQLAEIECAPIPPEVDDGIERIY